MTRRVKRRRLTRLEKEALQCERINLRPLEPVTERDRIHLEQFNVYRRALKAT
jgi:hypothetical protein